MSARDYAQLVKAYRSTRGYAVYCDIDSIQVSWEIFAGNERELLDRLSVHSDLSSLREFNSLGRRKELNLEFREMMRLLHNYVASAISLADHTRRIARKLLDREHLVMYQRRVDADFKNDPLARFLHDLRNVLLHVSIPSQQRIVRFDHGAVRSVGIQFSSEELLKYDEWSAPSRDFINHHKEGIEIAVIVREYDNKVLAFYKWLVGYFEEACKSDLDEFWAKHYKGADFCKANGIPTNDEEFARYAQNLHLRHRMQSLNIEHE